MVLISILSRKSARKNSLSFLLGFTLTLLALGIAGVYIFHLGGSGGTGKVDGYIDLSLGILCLLAMPLNFRRRKKQDTAEVESEIKALRAFSLGGITMLVNTSTIIIFVSGLQAISSANLEPLDGFFALVLLTLFTLVTLLIPTIIFFAFPKKSEIILASFKAWLSKHKKEIGAAVLLVFGAYLLVKGIRAVF